jgi:opacity protein-like surface antigen
MAELEQQADPEVIYALQTFKGTRIINGQSVETKGKGELEFIFSHRFGRINSGSYNFWGLDDAFVRLGLEYGLTDRLGVGVGRTSVDKTFDGYLRYKLFRQSSGAVNFPVTITAIGTTYIKTSPRAKDNPQFAMEDRMAYSAGLLIARKLNSNLSLQLTPVYVHRNAVVQFNENNDDMALGFGGRYKVTRSVALSGEYYYRLNAKSNSPNFDSVGFGVDIETGGHVFQLVFTNSAGMFERALISETTGDFFSGDVHFGFNITRNFQIVKKK